MLDWDTFRVVIAISREGSLSRAAKSLGISQPTVGRYLSRLEKRLGSKLFDRFNSGMFPTRVGQEVISSALRLEEEIQLLNLRVNRVDEGEGGEIRVSLPLHVMPYGLAGDIKSFSQKHPKIRLTFIETNECLDPHSRTTDIIIRAQDEPSSGLWGYKITDVKFSFFASKSFIEEWGPEIRANPGSVELPFLKVASAGPDGNLDYLKAKFPKDKLFGTCNTYDCLIPLVREGLAVGRIARFMAERVPELISICDCEAARPRSMWILTHPTLRDTPRVRLFMDFIKEQFREREMAF